MTYWILNSLSAFTLCVLFTGILIPQILLVAFKKDLFDQPDSRKIHHGAVPRLGGIAFTPAVCISISLLLGISYLLERPYFLDEMVPNTTTIAFGFCSMFILYLIGMADDLIGVRYRAKFVVQIFCAILLIAAGLWLNDLYGIALLNEIPSWVGMPMSIVAVVYIINAINLIDGIDGLASGLSAAALIIYGCAFIFLQSYIYAVISFAVLGVLVPFFYYNVFGNAEKQKKIFMGDTGSLTIGLILAFLSLELYRVSGPFISIIKVNPIILAFSPLIIPCFDVARVFLGRVRHHNNPFLPDKTHIHHKLLALGIPGRLCMVTIVTVALFTSALNIYLSRFVEINILLFIDIIAWTLANIWLSHIIASHK